MYNAHTSTRTMYTFPFNSKVQYKYKCNLCTLCINTININVAQYILSITVLFVIIYRYIFIKFYIFIACTDKNKSYKINIIQCCLLY